MQWNNRWTAVIPSNVGKASATDTNGDWKDTKSAMPSAWNVIPNFSHRGRLELKLTINKLQRYCGKMTMTPLCGHWYRFILAMEAVMATFASVDARKLSRYHEIQLHNATITKSALTTLAPGSGLEIHSHKYAGRKSV